MWPTSHFWSKIIWHRDLVLFILLFVFFIDYICVLPYIKTEFCTSRGRLNKEEIHCCNHHPHYDISISVRGRFPKDDWILHLLCLHWKIVPVKRDAWHPDLNISSPRLYAQQEKRAKYKLHRFSIKIWSLFHLWLDRLITSIVLLCDHWYTLLKILPKAHIFQLLFYVVFVWLAVSY